MPAAEGAVPVMQSQRYDLAVIGGGVIGLAVAWRASRDGLRVVVLDRGDPAAAASHVAAGMLAPVTEAEFGEEALLELNLASAARYPSWLEELADEAGVDPGYRRSGTLLVARDGDEAKALERLLAFRARLGLAIERLRPSEARRLEPALAPTVRLALHAPDDHAIDPRALVLALAAAAGARGAELRAGAEVAELLTNGARVEGVRLADGERVDAERVVVAAGCWSGTLPGLPEDARVPVRPVKGQILRLRDPAGPGLAERVLRTEECYLVPRGDGRYVLGASVEERGFDTAVTGGAVFELLRAAFELLPGVAELELEEAAAGLRPGTPDNAPAIGPGALDGLIWATGHHRNGILLAPATGDAVAELLRTGDLPELARPFAATRFGAGVTA
jgi:glycine oxidase